MKKVRGFNRYFDSIQASIKADSQIDLEFLNREKYCNFQFEDWYGSNIALKGKGRKFVLDNLLSIYTNWAHELKQHNLEYYLAIWLYDPRLELSEVVCAIDSKIEYYQQEALLDSSQITDFPSSKFKPFDNQLAKFNWTKKVDLEPTFEWEMNWPKEQYDSLKEYYSHQRFYRAIKKNAYRIIEREGEKIYFRQVGDIWVGQ